MKKKSLILEFFNIIYLFFKVRAIKCTEGEKITYGADKNQYYILKTPEKITNKTLTVYIHGGSFKHSSANFHNFVGDSFTKEGFINVNLCYRKIPDFKYPSPIEDVFSGLQHSINELKKRNIEIEDIVVSGSSAGAYLGAMICFNKKLQAKYNLNKYNFKGFCSLSGLINVNFEEKYNKYYKSIIKNFFAGHRDNPFDYIHNTSDIDLLVIHTTIDPVVEYNDTRVFFDSYKGNKEIYTPHDKLHCDICISAFIPECMEHTVLSKWLNKFL